MTREPFIAHSELTHEIYIVSGRNKYRVTEQAINAVKAIKALEQEPVLDKINKMKSEIADSLEFWDYSPNNNPLARDMLETLTNFWGDIKAESEG